MKKPEFIIGPGGQTRPSARCRAFIIRGCVLAICIGALALPSRSIAEPSDPGNQPNTTTETNHVDQTTAAIQTNRLADLSIDELMNIPVTLDTRQPRPLYQSAAAISVLTADDIRRSGAMSIPEALRLVPGLDVARVDSQNWAISARGFNDVFANKLLVMQDGRSIYTPLFSGVFWDVQNPLMEDIDRIEVIRGPGASLWGANAVNGVINIITKSAKETQGFLATAGGGSELNAFGSFQYGGKFGENAYFRVYGQYLNRGDSASPAGGNADDEWQIGQGGFRVDWDASEQNLFTLQGDIYGGRLHQTFGTYAPANFPTFSQTVSDDVPVDGGNILGRWAHAFSEDSELKLQLYYDRTERDTAIFQENRDTYDVDLQHHFKAGDRNDFIWGLGYRISADKIRSTPTVSFDPSRQETHLYSAFAQDEITLLTNRLRLTLGTRLEHNDYTGFEVQPNGRLLWTPGGHQTFWGAVSRAIRTPSRAEVSVTLNQPMPPFVVATLQGNPDYKSEELTAYEIGYRVEPLPNVSFDLATFYNVYDHLRSLETGTPSAPFPVFIPVQAENKLHGETYGFEASVAWQATGWWRLTPAYSLLKTQIHQDADSTDTTSINLDQGASPQQQFSLRSSMDLPQHVSLDFTLRYVDQLPALNVGSYVAVDVRLGWRPYKNLDLAIVGQNLGGVHTEFKPTFISTQPTEVRPSVYGKVTWRF
ncbi:MAG: ligand-gated TonB-dependent outer rane channel [Pedosphaera sp.]|nr:ligand-gated TonB-dependent outer rane channel [Pedosphaera sp.]